MLGTYLFVQVIINVITKIMYKNYKTKQQQYWLTGFSNWKGVRELNRKVLVIAVAFMALAMLATPIVGTVMAGKGQEKLYYEANIVLAGYNIDNIRTVPPGATPPNTVFVTASGTAVAFTLQIGSEAYTPTHYADMQITIHTRQNLVFIQIWETYTFEGVDGTIEISAVGKIYNYGDLAIQMSDTKIVGHGTGYFEGVKIMAEGNNELGNFPHKIHIGTIMGWPGLP